MAWIGELMAQEREDRKKIAADVREAQAKIGA